MATRVRLSRAASSLASDLFDRSWRILHAKRITQGGLTDEAEKEAWVEYYVDLQYRVLDRLGSGAWKCWGCWQGSAAPAAVPLELWQRSDVDLNLLDANVSWAGGWIDELTVEVTEVKRPKARRALTPAKRKEYRAWKLTLPGLPTLRMAEKWDPDHGRKLWEDDPEKRPVGRPRKFTE
jgi:hypothetical protein